MSRNPEPVTVPAELARALAYLAVTGARTIQARDGGLPLAPGMAALLAELGMHASAHPIRTVGLVQVVPAPGKWVTVGQAAELTGLSAAHVRRLALGGRLIARRTGRDWLVDADSAADYRKGRNVA